MRYSLFLLTIMLSSVMTTLSVVPAHALDVPVVNEARERFEAVQGMDAEVLAPDAFEAGKDALEEAEDLLKRGRDISSIKHSAKEALKHFDKAEEAVKLARVTFEKTLAVRDKALEASAPTFAREAWKEAQEWMVYSAEALEDGNVNSAKARAEETREYYATAELAAIKAQYLESTKQLLERFDDEKVDKYAPLTFEAAERRIAKAEAMLNKDRYSTEEPIQMAREANELALRAESLAEVLRAHHRRDNTYEQILLRIDDEFERLATAMDAENIPLEAGFTEATSALVTKFENFRDGMENQVAALQDRIQALSADKSDLLANIDELGQEIRDLRQQLGLKEESLRTAERQAAQLADRVTRLKEIQQMFVDVERMFPAEQAEVLRKEKEVILQMHGLNFKPGKSNLEPENYPLLTKVQEAIDMFPESEIIVEGHTDSLGSDERNLELSDERAETVRQYLIANMGIAPDRISAKGYGETKPVASNDTEEGRTRNRRIDVTIKPEIPEV